MDRVRIIFSVLFFHVAFLFQLVQCFPNGGPYKSCANLYPKHHTNAQSSTPPYQVSVNTTQFVPGDVIQVTLSGLDGASFKGFMVRANRLAGNTEDLVGEWFDLPDTANSRYWYPTEEGQTNCVTHKDPELKSKVTLYWRAPDYTLGDVQFYASFVASYDQFWVFVPSQVISGIELEDTKFNGSISTALTPIDLTTCGDTKGCMLYPPMCSPDDCTLAVTYRAHKDGVDFEAMVPQHGYLTFAISEDILMGNDETVTCISTNEFDSVQHGFNPSYYNDRHSIVGLINLETARIDGTLQCKWTMPYVNTITHLAESADGPPVVHIHQFDLHQKWHVFLAYGHIYQGADVLSKHHVLPLVSKNKVDFQDNSVVGAHGLYLPMKVHAILMMLGFMVLMGISVVVSRHYRNTFSREVLGVQAWFQVHRALMIAAAVFILISFIVIFATLKKWSEAAYTHAVMGTLTVGLVLVQILAGMLRPSVKSSKRPVFNWVHRIGGKVTQVFSAVTILLSLSLTYLNPLIQTRLTPVFAAWIVIQFFWEVLVLEVYKWTHGSAGKNTEGQTDTQEMSGLQDGQLQPVVRRGSQRFLTIEFILFSAIICVLTLAGIVILCMG